MESTFDRILMDGISDMVFVVRVERDPIFIYDFLNRAAMDETGLSQNAVGRSIRDVYKEETGNFLFEQYKKVITTGETVTYEDSYVSSKDERSYSKTTLTPLFDEQNQCKQIVAVVKDISKEKNARLEMEETWDKLQESNKRYQSLFHHNSDAIILFDLNGRIVDGNIAVESVTGYEPLELVGTTLNSLVVKEDANLLKRLFKQAITGTTKNSRLEIHNKSGQRIELSLKVTPLIIDEQVTGIYGILRDISDVARLIKKLEESEERFRIIAEHAQDLITLLDDRGKIMYVSPSYKNILGFNHPEYVGKFFLHNVHPDDRMTMDKVVIQSIKNEESFTVQFKQYNHKEEPIWCEAHGTPVFDNQGTFKHMVVLTRNISLQKEYERQLEHFALHDPLTGLPNRRLFKECLANSLKEYTEKQNGLAVIMMDIDHFKSINDEMGHDIGDEVIEEFGKRVRETIRDCDIVARLGGDEFVILLPGIGSAENAVTIAKNIQQAMQRPWNLHGNSLKVTTSMGIAMAPAQDATAFSMLKNADIALYEAKNAGRNSYQLRASTTDNHPSK
ncbi:PAS domain S-box protein [Virgibacillus sp. FSP13]